ncbi:MAG: carboxypeptidase-like regulatory domain-containing protein, partial [Deltaproteobacteria bacterium]
MDLQQVRVVVRARIFFLCLGVMLSPGLARGQDSSGIGSISGVIVSREGEQPLPNATVAIPELDRRLTADEKGEFTFVSVPAGTYSVAVNLVGYSDERVEGVVVQRNRQTALRIKMREAAIRLGEVQITGERARRLEDVRPSVLSVSPVRTKTLAGVG